MTRTISGPSVASILRGREVPRADPANDDLPYHERLNGRFRLTKRTRDWHPLPVLDPGTGRDLAWLRLRFEIVAD